MLGTSSSAIAPVGERGWKVAIAPLEPGKSDPHRVLLLANVAVSTAGDAERYVVIDGHRYSHIINPATGVGVEDRASVTVVALDGATADALETTVYVLGPERGLKLVDETPGAAAIFVRSTPDGIKTFESSTVQAGADGIGRLRQELARKASRSVQKPGYVLLTQPGSRMVTPGINRPASANDMAMRWSL